MQLELLILPPQDLTFPEVPLPRSSEPQLMDAGGVALSMAIMVFTASPSGRQQPTCAKGVGQLAYQASTSESSGGENVDIYRVCVDGSGQRRLTDWRGQDAAPAWSPDGLQIAFHSNRDAGPRRGSIPGYAIYVMNADGSGVRRVVFQRGADQCHLIGAKSNISGFGSKEM